MEYTFNPQTLDPIIQPVRYRAWYAKADLTNSLGKLKLPYAGYYA